MNSPQAFGKYQLLKKLATGGMAEVWLARKSGIEGFAKNVVIKRILPHLAEDVEFVEMFRNEALIAANFNHPNIAQVDEFGEANGTYYIAMEYIHGEDLGRVMRKAWGAGQWIARPLAIRIVASACEGLYYAHTRTDPNGNPLKVVHRDISPQNILISFDGSVKLVDFGIAKAADTVGRTKAGAIKGKFAYMAPEQAGGKPLDHRADIFAIGLVLYELLTGMRPLKRDSELATLQAALACEIQPPSEVADVPPELDSVVMSALAKASDDRYRDARQFQVALEETLVAQRWVASSVQISELMETLFADRLEEEKKTGNVLPATDDSGLSGQPRSLAEEMAEYSAPPGGGTAVARRRTGETPRRASSIGQSSLGRSNSRPEVDPEDADGGMEAPPPEPAPRRSTARPMQNFEEEDELPSRTRARRMSTGALAVDARARLSEEPDGDPERTRLPPPDYESGADPDETAPPPPRRRTGRVKRAQPAAEPPPPEASPAPRRRTVSRAEMVRKESPPPPRQLQVREGEGDSITGPRMPAAPRPVRPPINRTELLKKVFVGLFAVALAGGIVIFWPKLTKRAIDGVGIYVTVDTNPKVNVRVQHSDKCGSPEPITELGMTPIKGVAGAHLQDTLILENKTQGIYAVEEELLRFGEPGETKIIKREFRLGNVRLKVTPKNVGQLKISKEGQDLGVYNFGMKLELMEGTHKLELRGDQLKEPVEFEVTVKARDVTEEVVDVSAHLAK
jgi:serine/threonine protein kinase